MITIRKYEMANDSVHIHSYQQRENATEYTVHVEHVKIDQTIEDSGPIFLHGK